MDYTNAKASKNRGIIYVQKLYNIKHSWTAKYVFFRNFGINRIGEKCENMRNIYIYLRWIMYPPIDFILIKSVSILENMERNGITTICKFCFYLRNII